MSAAKQRLLSLDTLRGFDMFWIIGGDILFQALGKVTNWQWANVWAEQMDHVKWAGFHAYDLVFPLFMFISGVAIPYAIFGKLAQGANKRSLYKKIIIRAISLVLLGLVYNGLLYFDFSTLRFASVLGQIGLAYLIASVIVLQTKSFRARMIWLAGILTGYGVIQLLVPVPGCGTGILTPECSINTYIDTLFLPGQMYGKIFDPEGILCILSASGITLLGSLAGEVLRTGRFTEYKKFGILVISGITLIIATLLIQNHYPVIKAAWTSTFNMLTGGISLLLLSVFYLVADVWKIQKWTIAFRVIGMNSITIYMAKRGIDFQAPSNFLFHGFAGLFGHFAPIVSILGMLFLEWLLLYFLYKRSIFLKI
jgi:predicted acyltransferase